MINLTRSILLWVFLLSVLVLNGQTNYLNKKVILPNGKVTLKSILNNISTQTGCVFSYDPTKIIDKQLVSIPTKSTLSLRSTLTEVLPKNIQYKLNGKYIVLQVADVKNNIKSAAQATSSKSSPQSTKVEGKINKNPALERLVLPPINSTTNTVLISQTTDSVEIPIIDSVVIAKNDTPIQKIDSNLFVKIIADTVPQKQVLVTKADTAKIAKSGFGDFIKKNGFQEMGVSFNNQLAALSVRAGLYNVYSIVSIGSDYNDSYLLGIGAGINIKIDKRFSLNFDFLQNSLIAGKSYLLQVRASNSQFIPVLNYSLGNSLKFFAGPTVNLIKSSYVSSISSTDLGLLVGIGYSVGVKVDLKNLLSKKS
jgi:hypothetical protein